MSFKVGDHIIYRELGLFGEGYILRVRKTVEIGGHPTDRIGYRLRFDPTYCRPFEAIAWAALQQLVQRKRELNLQRDTLTSEQHDIFDALSEEIQP